MEVYTPTFPLPTILYRSTRKGFTTYKHVTSLLRNTPWPTMQDGSALFFNKVTAKGNFIFSIAVSKGDLLQPRNPFGRAPRSRSRVTSLCSSSTSDSMRRSSGTHEASHSKAIPLDVLFAAVPRYRNLSFFHSFFSDASFTRY